MSSIETLRPGDDGYDESARVLVGTGSPAVVVRPRTADEVAEAVTGAVRDGSTIAVRSGGHSMAGHGTNDGGTVIDLRHLDSVEVLDADRRLVRVGAGATWAKVAAALSSYGWSLTSGDTTSVGVGGLTLGGGVGWMVRKHGLTIDHLASARVVTADGRLLTASETENPDLFWALRGGGGNLGVVVDFDFVAHDTATVHFGTITYELDDAARMLTLWRDAMRAAPEELSSTFTLVPRFPGAPPTAVVLACYAGAKDASADEADAAFEPLLELGTVRDADIADRTYAEILEEPQVPPPGIRFNSRDTMVAQLDDAVIEAAAAAHQGPAPTAIAVRFLGGAFARVPADATAFAHRDAEAMVLGAVFTPDTATDAEVEAALGGWAAVAALGTGTYVGFQGASTDADVAAAYPPETYARLAEVKRTYDPDNVFRLNHNVEPATTERADPAA